MTKFIKKIFVFCLLLSCFLFFQQIGSAQLTSPPLGPGVGGPAMPPPPTEESPNFLARVFWGALSRALNVFLNIILVGAFAIPMFLAGLFLTLATGALWVGKNLPAFIQQSYTGMGNTIVALFWPMMRNLALVIIVFGFLIVGLATILGIEEHRARRKLVPLIVCAILLNFSNVICGFIVDISNVLMDFFLGQTGVIQILAEPVLNLWETVKDPGKWVESPLRGSVGFAMLFLTIYCFLAGVVVFIFALIFIFRWVAISILTALSPLAIASYVMPQIDVPLMPGVRKFFDWWLKQFLEWCFLGVTAAFFLFLGTQVLAQIRAISSSLKFEPLASVEENLSFDEFKTFTQLGDSDRPQTAVEAPTLEDKQVGDMVYQNLGYLAGVFCLYFALFAGFQTAAFGASHVLSLGKNLATFAFGAQMKGIASLRRALKEPARKFIERPRVAPVADFVRSGVTKLKRIPGARVVGSGMGKIGGWAKRIPELAGLGSIPAVREMEIEEVNKYKEQYKNAPIEEITNTVTDRLKSAHERVAAAQAAIERGEAEKLRVSLENHFKRLGFNDQQAASEAEKTLINLGKTAISIDPRMFDPFRGAFVHLGEKFAQGLSEQTQREAKLYGKTWQDILKEIKPSEIRIMDPKIFLDPQTKDAAFDAIRSVWRSEHWSEAGKNLGIAFCKEAKTFLENWARMGGSVTAQMPESAKNFLNSSAARRLFDLSRGVRF